MPISVGQAMAGTLTNDVIQLRLPLKTEYLAVLRATAGVIAGMMAFNYDEIMQLRVAISEVFDMATNQYLRQSSSLNGVELAVSFVPQPGGLEILIAPPQGLDADPDNWMDDESQALLTSLLDVVEIGSETGTIRMVKLKSAEREPG